MNRHRARIVFTMTMMACLAGLLLGCKGDPARRATNPPRHPSTPGPKATPPAPPATPKERKKSASGPGAKTSRSSAKKDAPRTGRSTPRSELPATTISRLAPKAVARLFRKWAPSAALKGKASRIGVTVKVSKPTTGDVIPVIVLVTKKKKVKVKKPKNCKAIIRAAGGDGEVDFDIHDLDICEDDGVRVDLMEVHAASMARGANKAWSVSAHRVFEVSTEWDSWALTSEEKLGDWNTNKLPELLVEVTNESLSHRAVGSTSFYQYILLEFARDRVTRLYSPAGLFKSGGPSSCGLSDIIHRVATIKFVRYRRGPGWALQGSRPPGSDPAGCASGC